MKTITAAGPVESPLPLNPASTVFPEEPPIGRFEGMKVRSVLPTRIALYAGWQPSGDLKVSPEWIGTIEEWWAANEETTWGDIRRMMDTLGEEGQYLTGGGAQPCYTVKLAK